MSAELVVDVLAGDRLRAEHGEQMPPDLSGQAQERWQASIDAERLAAVIARLRRLAVRQPRILEIPIAREGHARPAPRRWRPDWTAEVGA